MPGARRAADACAAVLAGGAATVLLSGIAARPRTPGRHVPLHGALHDGGVVDAHARADGAALEADGVEIVFAAPLIVDPARDLGGTRSLGEQVVPAVGLRGSRQRCIAALGGFAAAGSHGEASGGAEGWRVHVDIFAHAGRRATRHEGRRRRRCACASTAGFGKGVPELGSLGVLHSLLLETT